MNPDPLSELRDIHLPSAISWWPPAIGWWIVLLIFILLLAAGFWWKKRREALKNRPVIYSRIEVVDAALAELSGLENNMKAGDDAKAMAADLSRLLRRSAMRLSENPSDVAGLTGEAWLLWLDKQWSKDEFSNGTGRQLIHAQYQAESDINIEAVSRLCHDWLEAQR
jgi:hypothetical protein